MSFYETTAPYWRVRNSVKRYISYAESEKWQKATNQDFPDVLIVCETKALQKRLQNLTKRELDNTWADVVFEFLVVDH